MKKVPRSDDPLVQRLIETRGMIELEEGWRSTQSPIAALKQHLTGGEAAKGRDLAVAFPSFFISWVQDDDDRYKVMVDIIGKEPKSDAHFDDYVRDTLWYHTSDIPDELAEAFFRHGKREIIDSFEVGADSEAPSWVFMDFMEVDRNPWLMHFTDNAYEIRKSGFKVGVSDASKLGLTTQLHSFHKERAGYNFAFDVNVYDRYAKGRRGNSFKYGKDVVMFQAPKAIKVWHHGDEEPQMIFWGPDAYNIHEIRGMSRGHITADGPVIDKVWKQVQRDDLWLSKFDDGMDITEFNSLDEAVTFIIDRS